MLVPALCKKAFLQFEALISSNGEVAFCCKKKLDKGRSANCTRLTKAWIFFRTRKLSLDIPFQRQLVAKK